MPIAQTIPSPTQAGVTLDSYAFNAKLVFDIPTRAISLVSVRYADKASYEAGKPPIETITFNVTGDEFLAHVAANAEAYAMLKTAIEAYMLAQPQFAGGTEVD